MENMNLNGDDFNMDIEEYGLISILLIIILIIIVEILLIWIVASVVASFFGVSGLTWWAVAIVTFLVINAILNGLRGN